MNITKKRFNKIKKTKVQTRKVKKVSKKNKKKQSNRVNRLTKRKKRKYNIRNKTLKGGFGKFAFNVLYWPEDKPFDENEIRKAIISYKKKAPTPKNKQNIKQLEYLLQEGSKSNAKRSEIFKKWMNMSNVFPVKRGDDPLTKIEVEKEEEEKRKEEEKRQDLVSETREKRKEEKRKKEKEEKKRTAFRDMQED